MTYDLISASLQCVSSPSSSLLTSSCTSSSGNRDNSRDWPRRRARREPDIVAVAALLPSEWRRRADDATERDGSAEWRRCETDEATETEGVSGSRNTGPRPGEAERNSGPAERESEGPVYCPSSGDEDGAAGLISGGGIFRFFFSSAIAFLVQA